MKYEAIKQFSGHLIFVKSAFAYVEEAVCSVVTAEHDNEFLPDDISQSRENHFQPPNQSEPTQAQPGTSEKLEVMTERYRSGQPLHNPRDTACLDRRYGSRFYYEIHDQKTKI